MRAAKKKGGGGVKHHVENHQPKHVEHHHYKDGGKAHKGHKAEGHKGKHRADKRARGGRMTPSSPLSGAAPGKMRPGAKMGGHPDKEDD